ncbi:MAG TPA: sodium-dependent transporter [Steroidobacteraceae bacterium]
MSAPRTQVGPAWSSGFAFYLATVGASVGLGSIWRFPYLVGSGGGSAFIFAFVIACLLIATPLLAAEFIIGRHSRASPPRAAGILAAQSGLSQRWNLIGILGTVAGFLIVSYYAVIAGWVMAYTWKCASGALSGLSHAAVTSMWQAFLADPWALGGWHLAFVALVGVISARGVTRGLELANKIRAPVLLILMAILVVYSIDTGDVRHGLAFAFAPNFQALTPAVILAAIGQAFYATGVGMGMMLAYGSYQNRGTSLVRSSLIISAAILLVSLLATLTVFPLVFRYRMDPAQGVALVFDVLATVFAEMPGGRLIGTLFFLLLVFAALTPSLAAIEPMVAWLQQRQRLSRRAAVCVTAIAAWLAGIVSMLSFNRWADVRPLRWLPGFQNKSLFDSIDYVSSNLLLPIGALATSLFIGWFVVRAIVNDELNESTPLARRLCIALLRYLCPLAILAVFAANIY